VLDPLAVLPLFVSMPGGETPLQRRATARRATQSMFVALTLFALLDRHLARQPFMAGDSLAMADIPIACEVHRWWGLPQPRPAWPHLERWYAGWLAMPASRGVLDLPLS